VVEEVSENKISLEEEKAKRAAVDGYKLGEECPRNLGDNNRDKREIDPTVAQRYPARQQVTDSYTNETPTGVVRLKWQDGHHPVDRDNFVDAQIGVGTAHLHDDWKRSPPEILDQEPEKSRVGFMTQDRLPDSAPVYSQIVGGDELGYSTEQRAGKNRKGRIDDITGPVD